MSTPIGRVAQLIAGEDDIKLRTDGFGLPDTSASATPLRQNLEKLGSRIGVIAIRVQTRETRGAHDGSTLSSLLTLALCVAMSLSISCSDMVTKDMLVHKLAAVETRGSASVICSAKAGTLTEGRTTLARCGQKVWRMMSKAGGFDTAVGGIVCGDTNQKSSLSENIAREYKSVWEDPIFVLPQSDAFDDQRVRREGALPGRKALCPSMPGD